MAQFSRRREACGTFRRIPGRLGWGSCRYLTVLLMKLFCSELYRRERGKNDEEKSSEIWEHDYRMIIQISTGKMFICFINTGKFILFGFFFLIRVIVADRKLLSSQPVNSFSLGQLLP